MALTILMADDDQDDCMLIDAALRESGVQTRGRTYHLEWANPIRCSPLGLGARSFVTKPNSFQELVPFSS